MKKEHKTMSVVGALIVLLLVGYLYNRSNKEGMTGDGAKNVRSSDSKLNTTPKTPGEHFLYFLSMAWLAELFNKLTGRQQTQAAVAAKVGGNRSGSATRNMAAAKKLASARRARANAIARGRPGGVGVQRTSQAASAKAAVARNNNARVAASRAAAAVRASGKNTTGVTREQFANRGRGRVQRGGVWKPLGSIAPM